MINFCVLSIALARADILTFINNNQSLNKLQYVQLFFRKVINYRNKYIHVCKICQQVYFYLFIIGYVWRTYAKYK